MRTFIAAFLLSFPVLSYGACQNLLKVEGSIDLSKKSWETLNLDKEKTKVCVSINDENANLEIVFRRDKKEFKTKIYSSLDGYYDTQNAKKQMTGGKFPLNYIFIETWAPDWAKESSLTVTETSSKNILVETKL